MNHSEKSSKPKRFGWVKRLSRIYKEWFLNQYSRSSKREKDAQMLQEETRLRLEALRKANKTHVKRIEELYEARMKRIDTLSRARRRQILDIARKSMSVVNE